MKYRNIISYPLRRLKRYRIGRGYSVHSPFAFYFITRVLREKLPYYCFQNEITDKPRRCLFRVINYFHPETIFVSGECSPALREVITKAAPKARFTESPVMADFTISTNGEIPAEAKVAYCTNCLNPPSDAMTFSNGNTVIAIRRTGLPHQHFNLNF